MPRAPDGIEALTADAVQMPCWRSVDVRSVQSAPLDLEDIVAFVRVTIRFPVTPTAAGSRRS